MNHYLIFDIFESLNLCHQQTQDLTNIGTLWNTTGYIFKSGAFVIACNVLFGFIKIALKARYIVSFYSKLI